MARAKARERAQRVNLGAELLAAGLSVAEAARELAVRQQLSERQARRYVERARTSGPIPVPGPVQVFTVKLPVELVARIREYARTRGRALSCVVAQALTEFLGRRRTSPNGGRKTD